MTEQQTPDSNDPYTQANIEFKTSITSLLSRFYFHDKLVSSSGFSNHYIVEDLQTNPENSLDQESQFFYYLKQTVYPSKAEYLHALSFYQKIYQYGKAKFCKSDMIKLHFLFFHENESKKAYELVVVFDFGEPDRIDMDIIETKHINKFLKNVCTLLSELKKFDNLYHSNIEVPNIVLVDSELKMSAFKPRYVMNPNYNSWKIELIRKYGHFRLDLYLIGILWLKFLKVPQINKIARNSKTLEDLIAKSNKLMKNIKLDERTEIVRKLIDIEKHPHMTIEDLLISFDENYVLENIQNSIRKERPVDERKKSFPLEYNTYEKFEMHKSGSKDSNLFLRPYRESMQDLNYIDKGSQSKEKETNAELIIDREFTLRHHDSTKNLEEQQDDLIDVVDERNPQSITDIYESKSVVNRSGSHRNLGADYAKIQNFQQLRKLKSDQKLMIYGDGPREQEENITIPKPIEFNDSHKPTTNLDLDYDQLKDFKKKDVYEEEEDLKSEEAPPLVTSNQSIKKPEIIGQKKNEPQEEAQIKKKTDGKQTDTYSSIKPNKKKDEWSKNDLERKEKEKELKMKIEKKLAENLKKKKEEKLETINKIKENVKSKKEFDFKRSGEEKQQSARDLMKPDSRSSIKKTETSTLDEINRRLLKRNVPGIVSGKDIQKINSLGKNPKPNTSQSVRNITIPENKITKDIQIECENSIEKKKPSLGLEVLDSQMGLEQVDLKTIDQTQIPKLLESPSKEKHQNVLENQDNNNAQYFSKETDSFNSNVESVDSVTKNFIKNEILEVQFKQSLSLIKTLFLDQNYEECFEILKQFSGLQNPATKIEFVKLKSLIYFKLRQFDIAKQELCAALKILNENPGLANPKEILQSILTNIAIIEFQSGKYIEVIEIMSHKIFDGEDGLPKDHYQVIADSFFELGAFAQAFFNYDKTLQILMVNDLHPSDLALFRSIAARIITCLVYMNESGIIFKFISSVVEILNKYKPAPSKQEEKQSSRIIENFIYSTFRLIVALKNLAILEGLVKFVYDEKIILFVQNFEDNETLYLIDCVRCFIFMNPGTSRLPMIKIANYFADLIKNDEKRKEVKFFLLFKKGMVFIEGKDYQKAIKSFQKSLELSSDPPQIVKEKIQNVFLNIGVCNWHLGKIEESSFYFDKVLIDDYLDQKMEIKVLKMLCKVYYKLGIYKQCKIILEDLIEVNDQTKAFIKYLVMYYVCCEKMGFNDMSPRIFAIFNATIANNEKSELRGLIYFMLIKNLISEERFFDAEQLLTSPDFMESFNGDPKTTCIINLNRLRIKLLTNTYHDILAKSREIQASIHSFSPEFSEQVNNFLLNLRFILLSKLDFKVEDLPERQLQIDEILSMKEYSENFDQIFDILKEQREYLNSISFTSESRNLNFPEIKPEPLTYHSDGKLIEEQIPKTHCTAPKKNNINGLTDVHSRNDLYKEIIQKEYFEEEIQEKVENENLVQKKIRRIKSTEIIQKSNPRKSKCFCFEFNRQNPELVKIMRETLMTIKLVKMDPDYFRRIIFELRGKLEVKKLKFLKYGYIKKILKIIQKFQHTDLSDLTDLHNLFESLLTFKEICLHDLKKMLTLFEAVSNMKNNILSFFIYYLDVYHKNLARYILNSYFLVGYQKKYGFFVSEFYEKVYNSPQNAFKSFALMHYLDIKKETRSEIRKAQILDRLRYKFITSQSNHVVCNRYLPQNALIEIYLNDCIKQSIDSMIANEAPNDASIIIKLKASIQDIFEDYPDFKLSNKFYVYEYLMCLFVVRAFDSSKVIEAVFDTLIYLESKMELKSLTILYHFSIVCSFIGNLFFYQKLFDPCLKVKHMALISFKRVKDVDMTFPIYLAPIEPTTLMYSILSFNVLANIELDNISNAKNVIAKLKLIKFESQNIEFEKRLIFAFYEICYGILDVARQIIDDLERKRKFLNEFGKNKEMYEIVLKKLASLIQKSGPSVANHK